MISDKQLHNTIITNPLCHSENHRFLASFPGFPAPECKYAYTGRAWYLFSCEHDIIKKGSEFLEQKGNV